MIARPCGPGSRASAPTVSAKRGVPASVLSCPSTAAPSFFCLDRAQAQVRASHVISRAQSPASRARSCLCVLGLAVSLEAALRDAALSLDERHDPSTFERDEACAPEPPALLRCLEERGSEGDELARSSKRLRGDGGALAAPARFCAAALLLLPRAGALADSRLDSQPSMSSKAALEAGTGGASGYPSNEACWRREHDRRSRVASRARLCRLCLGHLTLLSPRAPGPEGLPVRARPCRHR